MLKWSGQIFSRYIRFKCKQNQLTPSNYVIRKLMTGTYEGETELFNKNEFLVDILYHSKYIGRCDNVLDNFIDLLNFKSTEEIAHIE